MRMACCIKPGKGNSIARPVDRKALHSTLLRYRGGAQDAAQTQEFGLPIVACPRYRISGRAMSAARMETPSSKSHTSTSTSAQEQAINRFGASLGRMATELDWERLGKTYCWEGGEDFFGDEDQARLLDAGLAIATDLAAHLQSLPVSGPQRSLFVGVGLAELAPIAFEAIVLGRDVVARSLDGEEVHELNRAASLVSKAVCDELGPGIGLPQIEACALEEAAPSGPLDHLWFVSLISDPEAFPALHDELYGREEDEFATGRGDLAKDTTRAEALVEVAISRVVTPAILTTTDEELPFLERALERRGMTLSMSPSARLSPIVGDPLRHGRIELAGTK